MDIIETDLGRELKEEFAERIAEQEWRLGKPTHVRKYAPAAEYPKVAEVLQNGFNTLIDHYDTYTHTKGIKGLKELSNPNFAERINTQLLKLYRDLKDAGHDIPDSEFDAYTACLDVYCEATRKYSEATGISMWINKTCVKVER